MNAPFLTGLLAVALLALPHAHAGIPGSGHPTNDAFSTARPADVLLRPFTANLSTLAATLEPVEQTPCGMSATVWYYTDFERGAAGPVSIDTFGSTANTVLAVYVGTKGERLLNAQLLTCNDDAPGYGTDSEITFSARPDRMYFFQVGTREGADRGDVTFHVRGATPPLLPQESEGSGPV